MKVPIREELFYNDLSKVIRLIRENGHKDISLLERRKQLRDARIRSSIFRETFLIFGFHNFQAFTYSFVVETIFRQDTFCKAGEAVPYKITI